MKTALSYIRVSTDRQAEKYSLPAQKRINQETAQKLQCVIVREYEDAGCSAGSLETMPSLQKLLSELPEIQSDYLLVTDIDRLGRGYDFFFVLKQLITHDVSIYTEAGQESELVTGFRALIGLEERKALKARTRRGKEQAARQGKFGGGRPVYGYRMEQGKLVINPQEQEILKLIFKWLLEGYGYKRIARTLNSRGIRTRKGHLWRTSSVFRLIINRTLIGEIPYRGSWHDGQHEPVIDRDVFEKAQRISEGRKIDHVDLSPKFVLSGFVYCGRCGTKLVIGYKGPGQKMYRCRETGYGLCRGVYISEEILKAIAEKALFDHCRTFEIGLLDQGGSKAKEMAELKSQIRKLDRQIEEVMTDYYERHVLRQEDYYRRYQKLTEIREELESEIKILAWQDSEERRKMIAQIKHTEIADAWSDMEVEEKRQVLALFVDKIIVHPDPERRLKERRVEIVWK